MRRENFNDLYGFLVVGKAGSFTKAAAELGVTPSALSQSISALETRLGVLLLSRTTRSVAPTSAGERLLQKLSSSFETIGDELEALTDSRDQPAGFFRITTVGHAAEAVLWPKLVDFLKSYPDIRIELVVDYRMVDIVAERYDAGVRLGAHVDKDMISVRVSADKRMAVVATPEYLRRNPPPDNPKDLVSHSCLTLRLPTLGGLMQWSFECDGVATNVPVSGQCVFSNSQMALHGALAGLGLANVPEDIVQEHIAAGRLMRVLERWCKPLEGYHFYYPRRRQSTAAFRLLVDALRHRE